jgi:hypothetical protein
MMLTLPPIHVSAAPGVLSSSSGQRVGAPGVSAAAAAAGVVGGEDEPLVLALAELLAVRRCAEPSLPEGGGIWVSTTGVPTVSVNFKGVGVVCWRSACAALVSL